jgi:hypothetical protein
LFGIGCTFNREWECNLHSPEIIAKIYPPTQLLVEDSSAPAPSSHCWLEFGSTFDGDFYALDLSSPSMPRDARVLLWDYETARPIKTWDSVVSFIAEMLGPVEV